MASAVVPDDLGAALRARGLRTTPQRRDVLHAVHRLGHATPEQIAGEVGGVDLTTVYRTLQLLEDLGLLAHTHLGHGAPSYRPADDAHVHVVCHACGSVIDAPADLADDVARRLDAQLGFTVDVAHFTVFGHCADCARRADAAAGPRRREHTSPGGA
jgi:Fur family ferric uptake transcriptional regulator